MICLKLHNLCYILNPNQGRQHCNTSLESLKHDNMTLFYKKCQKNGYETSYTASFSVVIHTTTSRDPILRRSPDVEFTSDSRTQLRDVIWIKYISTTTKEM